MKNEADVLILGGGVAGLSAAGDLTASGLKVILVEGRNRLGGRICTKHELHFPVELGAEFVHGGPREILDLAKDAGLKLAEVEGEFRQKRNGLWGDSGSVMAEVNHLFEKMPADQPDQSFQQYLDSTHYSEATRQQAINFVQGFHAADPSRVSVHWLIKTTKAEEEIAGEASFRMADGYDGLVLALEGRLHRERCHVILSSPVTTVEWRKGEVTMKVSAEEFRAPRSIITLPLGVLKANTVRFMPALAEKQDALNCLEMGPVIRVSLCFRERFWEQRPELRNLSFLFTDDPQFPTWWTTNPLPYPILTGWAAGKYARALAGRSHGELTQRAVDALARILEMHPQTLSQGLVQGFAHDWQSDRFSIGAYSYVVVGGACAIRSLAQPLADTLFFAGEATHADGHNGTVHGAIATGQRAAREIREAVGARAS